MALVLFVLLISYASSLRAWLTQRDEIDAARAELTQSTDRVEALEAGQERWRDPAYVIQEARRRLDFVQPGEVGYHVLGADGQPLDSDVRLDEPVVQQPPETDWYSTIWASVQQAGTPGSAE